jgi:hypothetical protein
MKHTLTNYKARLVIGAACLAIVALCWNGGNTCQAQTSANLSPGLQEVVKLTKAQMADDVIVSYIKNSGTAFHLTADDMLYLKDQGVSQTVISVLLQAKTDVPVPIANPTPAPHPQPAPAPVAQQAPPAPADAPPPPGPPAQEVNFNYFHDQLAPFGTWADVGGVQYWLPAAAIRLNPDFRPYYDNGKWIQTDNGLFWQSDYQWGDIPFHYGRWVILPGMGWAWAPGYEWGPAWVFWRHAEAGGAIGWAPLPVGAEFVGGAFMFNGVAVGADFEFGLGEGAFTFVDYDHFHEGFFRMRGHEYAYHIHGDRFHDFYRHSLVRNEFRRDEHGRFVNNGIGRDRMERATHGRMEHSGFEERKPVGDRNKLAADRSRMAANDSRGRAGASESREKTAAGENHGKTVADESRGKTAAAPSKVFRPPAAAPKAAAKSSAPSSGGGKKK